MLDTFTAVCLHTAPAAPQLPPEIMADRYMIQAEMLHAEEDFEGAYEVMAKIIALQNEHNLELPDEFHFKYARVALSADSVRIAIDSIGKYLSATGKQGEFYKEALALSIEAERPRISPDETCAGKPDGASCWKAFSNHADCNFWITDLERRYTAAWSGKCSGRFATGQGTITWSIARGDSVRITKSEAGLLRIGRRHGKWNTLRNDGSVWYRTQYVDGMKHGQAEYLRTDGSIHRRQDFVDGKLNGQDVNFYKNGSVWIRTHYMDGKMHGQYESFGEDGSVSARGSYVVGKQHGQWVYFDGYGNRMGGGKYVNGEKHGHWIEYSGDHRGTYANGEKSGVWYYWDRDERKCRSREYLLGSEIRKLKKVKKKMCGRE